MASTNGTATQAGETTHAVDTLGTIRALASVLLERADLASRAGITFGGARDLYTILGYKRDLQPQDLRARYKREDIAARIVDTPAEATWRGEPKLVEDDKPDHETVFEKAVGALFKRLRAWSVFERADKLAQLGRYSIVLIGAPGKPDTPLENTRAEQVMFLTPVGEPDVKIRRFDSDLTSPRFGLPVLYSVQRTTLNEAGAVVQAQPIDVHWTRVIHVADDLLDDDVYGRSRLQLVWNRLDDLQKVAGGAAEAFWLTVNRGMQLDVDKEMELSPEDAKMLTEEIEEYMHQLRRFLRTKGVKVTPLGAQTVDPKGAFEVCLALISGATGIPQRILLGSERGELASTQDRENWAERVMARRTQWAAPLIVQPFIDRLIGVGALPQPKEYQINWPTMTVLSEKEHAEVVEKVAKAAKALAEQANMPTPVIANTEARTKYFDLPDTLPEIKRLEVPMPAPAPAQGGDDDERDRGE